MDICRECGFSYDQLPTMQIGPAIREILAGYPKTLLRPEVPDMAAVRPSPGVWSALEYCCHVRDVLLVQRERVLLALVEVVPSFARMYRDERVEFAGYRQESLDPAVEGLVMAGDLLARVFEARTSEELSRRCVYNYPTAAERNIAWLGRHSVHEGCHHLLDIRTVLERVGGAPPSTPGSPQVRKR